MRLRLKTIYTVFTFVSCHFAFGQSSFKRAGDFMHLQVERYCTVYVFTEVSIFMRARPGLIKGTVWVH